MRLLACFAVASAVLSLASIAAAQPLLPPPPPPPPRFTPPPPRFIPPPPRPFVREQPAFVVERPRRESAIELTPMIGYQLGGSVDTYRGTEGIGNAATYGATLDARVYGGASLELGYRFQNTEIDMLPYQGGWYRLFGVTAHYFEIGANEEFLIASPVRPFVGASFGGALFAPQSVDVANDFRLLGALYGGAKIYLSPGVALRIQAKVSTVFLSSSSSVFCATGYGCAYGFGGVGIPQLELALGPTIVF